MGPTSGGWPTQRSVRCVGLLPLLLSLQSLLLAAKLTQGLADSGAFTNPGRATLGQVEIESE